MRPKLTLKDLKFVPKEAPVAPPPSPPPATPILKVVRPPPAGMEAIWLPLRSNWLRVVMDNRVGAGRRIFKIELYDKDQTERLAVFRRQTEAMRR